MLEVFVGRADGFQYRSCKRKCMQLNSHLNKFMSERTDPDWVYRCDAGSVPLEPAPPFPA